MAKEIERKFLVRGEGYRMNACASHHICQGYLSRNKDAVVRVRVRDDRAFLTIKSITVDFTRDEWEYEIPLSDAEGMLRLCGDNLIEKTRYIVMHDGMKWEVDEFAGRHSGLVVAEVELPSEDASVSLPDFAGEEVTGNPRYYNSNL